jgi:DNA-binding protein HU-beta
MQARHDPPAPQVIPDPNERPNTMNKQQLIEAAADASDLSKNEMSGALDAILDTLTTALKGGDKVTLTGFGNFEVRERAARTGRNPQTGAEMQISASKAPAFKPGKALKDAVNK